jgi:hypothetical protein
VHRPRLNSRDAVGREPGQRGGPIVEYDPDDDDRQYVVVITS